jgi:hypothetical protein
MSKQKISSLENNHKFKLNLIGENNNVQLIGSSPGKIFTLICAIFCFTIFVTLIVSMISGEND